MPGFNQTGPNGQGPMTGRRMGRCTNFGASLKNQSATIVNENPNENNPENVQDEVWLCKRFCCRGRVWDDKINQK